MKFLKKYKIQFLLGLILLFALLVRVYQINESWSGRHDANGATFSLIAKNYLRFGYFNVKFGQVINSTSTPSEDFIFPLANLFPTFSRPEHSPFIFYITHPPLLPIILSFNFLLFGESEISARSMSIFFSLLSIIVLFLIAKKGWNRNVALYTSFFLAFMPLSIYFGRGVSHEPLLLFFVLLTIYFYLLWLEKFQKKYFILMLIIFILGALIDWPMYYLPPLLLIHFLMIKGPKEKFKLIVIFQVIAIFLFIFYFLYTAYLITSFHFLEKFLKFFLNLNLGLIHEGYEGKFLFQLSFFDIISRLIKWSLRYFTLPVILFSVFWFFYYYIFRAEKKENQKNLIIIILFAFAGVHIFTFKVSAWIHEYWLYYTLPALALTGGLILKLFEDKIREIFIRYFLLLIILILFLSFSLPATDELYNIVDNRIFYSLGKFLKEKTLSNDKVITSLPFINLIINYYSDREIYWHIKDRESLLKIIETKPKEKYYFLMLEGETGQEKDLRKYLFENYPFQKDGEIFFFDLNKKLTNG